MYEKLRVRKSYRCIFLHLTIKKAKNVIYWFLHLMSSQKQYWGNYHLVESNIRQIFLHYKLIFSQYMYNAMTKDFVTKHVLLAVSKKCITHNILIYLQQKTCQLLTPFLVFTRDLSLQHYFLK